MSTDTSAPQTLDQLAAMLQNRREQLRRVERDLEAMRGNLPSDADAVVSEAHTRAALKETAEALQAEIGRLEAQRKAEQERIRKEQARADTVAAIKEGTEAMRAMGEAMEAAVKAAMPHLEKAQEAYVAWHDTGQPMFYAAKEYAPGIQRSRKNSNARIETCRQFLDELEAEGHDWRIPLQHIRDQYREIAISRVPRPKAAIGEPMYRTVWTMLAERWQNVHRAYEEAQAEAREAQTDELVNERVEA